MQRERDWTAMLAVNVERSHEPIWWQPLGAGIDEETAFPLSREKECGPADILSLAQRIQLPA